MLFLPFFIAHRGDINKGDQFGRSPLMFAVLADRLDCAEVLIKSGAKVNFEDNGGRTALHWAAYKVRVWLIYFCCKNKSQDISI